jgi:hypothetical protein
MKMLQGAPRLQQAQGLLGLGLLQDAHQLVAEAGSGDGIQVGHIPPQPAVGALL